MFIESFDRVVSAGVQGVAAEQTRQRQQGPPEGTVAPDRQNGVVGAGGVKAAAGAEKGRQKDLIGPDRENERFGQDLLKRKIKHSMLLR